MDGLVWPVVTVEDAHKNFEKLGLSQGNINYGKIREIENIYVKTAREIIKHCNRMTASS